MTTGETAVATNSVRVAFWTIASRVTGLGRAVIVAAVLGPTYLGNLFQATYVLPALLYQSLVGSLLTALLVPPLIRYADPRDARGAERLASGFLSVAGLVFLAVAALAVLAAPLLLGLFALGVEDQGAAADQRRVGWIFLGLMMPQVVLLGIAGTAGAVMNANGRFALAAAAPAFENLGVIAVMVITAVAFGTGTELDAVTTPQLLLLGLGSTAAVALHAGVQWWGAARAGVRLRPRAGWRDPEVRRVLSRSIPSLGVAGLDSLRQFAVLPVANRVPGGVVAFQLALNLASLPVALVAKPVATALLPQLATLFRDGRERLFRDELVRGLSLALFLTVPAAVAYVALAIPLSRAVGFGEMATPAAVLAVAVSIAALAPGIVGDASFFIRMQASYAMDDVRSPLRSMLVRTAASFCGFAIAFALEPGAAVLVALGLALSAGNLIGTWHLQRGSIAKLPDGGERLGPSFLRTLAASVVMACPAYAVATVIPDWLPEGVGGPFGEVLGVAVAGVVGATTFVGVQALWRSPELASMLAALGDIRVRGRA